MATNAWLEDLSEDWIPQVRSTSSVSASPQANSTTHNADDLPSQARSRIPRLRTSSSAANNSSALAAKKRPVAASQRKSVSVERSLSADNIQTASSPPASESKSSRSGLSSRSFSAASIGSVVRNGTVEQKPSARTPGKTTRMHDTPEWRKRLLKGEMGYSDQKDLFSPIGIEKLFSQQSKPNPRSSPATKSRQSFLRNLDTLPSSPPPWPSRSNQQNDSSILELHTFNEEDDIEDEYAAGEDSRVSSNNEGARMEDPSVFGDTYEAKSFQNPENTRDDYRHSMGHEHEPESEPSGNRSGELELRNEEFSPVYLSKNNTAAMQFDYVAPLDDHSHITDQADASKGQMESELHKREDSRYLEGTSNSSLAKILDETLPADLPVGTPDVMGNLGKFVTTRRGGYSNEGSFQHRPLSSTPPASNPVSRLDDGSNTSENVIKPIQSSGMRSTRALIPPTAPSPPAAPFTPSRRHNLAITSPNCGPSSRSPLKLFGDHDTFTANRLHRRLSQLELGAGSTKKGNEFRLTSVKEHSINVPETNSPAATLNSNPTRVVSKASSFGTGKLEDYQFSDKFSMVSSNDNNSGKGPKHDSDTSPSPDVVPPGSQPKFRFTLEQSPPVERSAHGKHKLSRTSLRSSRTSIGPNRSLGQLRSPKLRPRVLESFSEVETGEQSKNTDGKRPPTSPAKNPTPKRRRTLHRTDLAVDLQGTSLGGITEKNVAIQSIIGKRKDARQGIENNVADPDTLARRHILRPRNPTPSQRRRDEIQAEVLEATDAYLQSSPPQLKAIREDLDVSELDGHAPDQATAVKLATEVAAYTFKAQKVLDDSRKRSVTTQDFLDEAMKIMEFIRTKGRPASGLGSLEESESGHADLEESENRLSPSPIPFSRPASRNGPPSGWRNPQAQELQPHVVNHLRKFKEASSDFIPSSVRSLRTHPAQHGGVPIDQYTHQDHEDGNIRIREPLSHHTRAPDGHFAIDEERAGMTQQTQSSSHNTNPSYDSSAGKSNVTNTSKRSDAVATLAPEAVAHLIPDEVAGMTFDREKRVWTKKKGTDKERPSEISVESEDDPFKNIPDLTVDEIRELNTLSIFRGPTDTRLLSGVSSRDFLHSSSTNLSSTESRPRTREESGTIPSEFSTINSKPMQFSSSTDPVETRATSWSEQEIVNRTRKQAGVLPINTIHAHQAEDVEHEIQIHEGRTLLERQRAAKVRDVTITFSSPAGQRYMSNFVDSNLLDEPSMYNGQSQEQHGTMRRAKDRSSQPYPHVISNTLSRRSTKWENHYTSSSKRDEPSEMSFSAAQSEPARTLFSVNVSGTLTHATAQHAMLPQPSSPSRADVTFYLSELPDFSVNQIDERELSDRVLVRRSGQVAIEDRFAQGTTELVKALQDVEPDEPFWEDLRKVNLSAKRLTNLHRLDAFCWSLEDVDVSDNAISQLNGAPLSIRRFSIKNNCLTSLSSWGHLSNLQYLDVSGNDIDSLDGFASLIHLRELMVNDNRIESLDGILGLDGLIKLTACDNKLTVVDLERSDLKCLTELDLSGNQINNVKCLHHLTNLRNLNLDNNRLEYLLSDSPIYTLRTLNVSRNELVSFAVDSSFPCIERLHADRNRLHHVEGIELLPDLLTFSLREQRRTLKSSTAPDTARLPISPPSLSVLSFSATLMPTLQLSSPYLVLQRLELASCGLQSLPTNFSQLVPNVRYLNLNSNGLKDICPLLNTKALSELHLAGNRIARLRKTTMILARLKSLTKLDLRDNAMTVGFYPSAIEGRIVPVNHCDSNRDEQITPFTLPPIDPPLDAKHCERLDEGTRIRRRVYEMLVGNSCKLLRSLDGIDFDSVSALAKDEVFERLRLLGVLIPSQRGDESSSE